MGGLMILLMAPGIGHAQNNAGIGTAAPQQRLDS